MDFLNFLNFSEQISWQILRPIRLCRQKKSQTDQYYSDWIKYFLTFPACFSNPNFFSNLNFNCSNLPSLRNLQKQVKKAFCHQKLFWPFTVWINCSSDLKNFANSRLSASNFKSFSFSLEHFWWQIFLLFRI